MSKLKLKPEPCVHVAIFHEDCAVRMGKKVPKFKEARWDKSLGFELWCEGCGEKISLFLGPGTAKS